MPEILLVRHSKTYGNTLGRYIGSRTDEPLCQEGIDLLKMKQYPAVDRIYASTMKRCVETAQIIWPELADRMITVPDLRECDFGEFENKNYQELNGNPVYQAWIDSNGAMPFPGGESAADFKERCQKAFTKIVEEIRQTERKLRMEPGKENQVFSAAIVVHGGTIMSALEKYGFPQKGYYDYQVKNGCGYLLTPVEGTEFWNCQYEEFYDTMAT